MLGEVAQQLRMSTSYMAGVPNEIRLRKLSIGTITSGTKKKLPLKETVIQKLKRKFGEVLSVY